MAKFSDLDKRDEVARQSEASARRSLNALAVTSSIVKALVQHPGPVGEHGSMVQAAKTMLDQADEMATRLTSRLELASVPWARYRIMRMTTEAVSNRWISSARESGTPSADISDFLPVWREMAKHDLPSFQFTEPSKDERVMMQVSVLDSMQPVLQEIAIFDLFHDPVTAAMHAREQIVGAANEAVAELLPPNASRQAQAQLLEALLRNAGSVYASNWRRFSEEVVDRLQPMTVEQQEQEVAARPGGWPLDAVDERFRSTFDKLVDMVAFLSRPMEPSKAIEDQPKSADAFASATEQVNAAPASLSGLFDATDGTQDMDEAPDWDDEGPDMPRDKEFAATALMVEPTGPRKNEPEKGVDSPAR